MLELDIISMGEPMAEFCATEVGRLKDVTLFKRGWGGDTSNFIVAAARLGARVGYVCRIGDDVFGESFMELWSRNGVDISNVIVESDGFTGVYFISLLPGGGHDFIYYRKGSAASHLKPEDVNPDYIVRAKVFHTSGITLAISENCMLAAFKAMEIARSRGRMVSFDVNFRPKLWSPMQAIPVVEKAVRISNIVFASLEDLKLLYGIEEASEAVKKLKSMGVETVVIKLGAEGCLAYSGGRFVRGEAFKVEVVDTTGAGDSFDAAFVVGLLKGWSLEKIIAFANAVGALTSTGFGAVEPIPSFKEAIRFLKERGVEVE